MPYAWMQDLPIDQNVYQRIRSALGSAVPPGLIIHLVTPSPTGSGLRYIDVWESRADCDRFLEERVHPVLGQVFAAAGRAMPPDPPRDELELIDLFGPGLVAPRA
jgi:hypothetical protein